MIRTLPLLLTALLLPGAAQAEPALDECWAVSASRMELVPCLNKLKGRADDRLAEVLQQAREAEAKLDEQVGLKQATRALERSQMAFELYRNLECHLQELQAGRGSGSGDFFLGCWVDLTRNRLARLEALLENPRIR